MKAFLSLLLIVCSFFACMLCLSYLLINPFTDNSVLFVYLLIVLIGFFAVQSLFLLDINN